MPRLFGDSALRLVYNLHNDDDDDHDRYTEQ